MGQLRTSRTFDIVFVIALLSFLWWATAHRVTVGDWVYFLSYHPDQQTVQVASDAGLSEAGRRLLYRTNPQFETKDQIAARCDIERLGCIDSKGQVYILDDPGKHDQAVVTAAHEMLHLAYRRLSAARKQELAPLIDDAIDMNTGIGISSELENQTNPDDRRDEAHSLLGSEYKDLPPELEQYYSQYFSDRSKVVAAEAASAQ